MAELVRYRTVVYDSARWAGFAFRHDDIVVDTPPKSGTTWMQHLVAMVLFDTTELDRPLAQISPWLDMQTNDPAQVVAGLEAQRHRRFVKTHTPLDGIPVVPGVTYLCVGRDPRDVALSFHRHWSNLDLDAVLAARARAVGLDDLAELRRPPPLPDDPLERFRRWVEAEPGHFVGQSLAEVLHHLRTFWDRRHEPGVELFHYRDLVTDLPGQIRRLGQVLGVPLADEQVARYAAAASFDAMKARADQLAPDVDNRIWRSNEAFFDRGPARRWSDVLDEDALSAYHQRVAALVPPDLVAWAHGGWLGSPATAVGTTA